jgi:hypothetical protein
MMIIPPCKRGGMINALGFPIPLYTASTSWEAMITTYLTTAARLTCLGQAVPSNPLVPGGHMQRHCKASNARLKTNMLEEGNTAPQAM